MRTPAGFAYIWEYRVEADQEAEFLRLYGPGGEWVRLFRKAEGFVETHLLRDADDRGRFVTIDYWTSREARDRFRRDCAAEFSGLDAAGEATTVAEELLGDFEPVE